ncbi:MAG: LuxR C-terminal-related transcriptional regulator [Lachnospiraceae bacterium]|nr:LuxR C-terminal-related transcriptional regulator [Lachnospiraceae bacterium]
MVREGKYRIDTEKDRINRSGLIKQMDRKLKEYQILFFAAGAGSGKTTAAVLFLKYFLKKQPKAKAAYYIFDENDNTPGFLLAGIHHLLEKIKGKKLSSADNLRDEFSLFLKEMEEENQVLFIFDHIETMENLENIRQMKLFFEYLPKQCKIILLGRRLEPEAFLEMIYSGRAAAISGEELLFSKREIVEFFQKKQKKITAFAADELYQYTGGWPGACEQLTFRENSVGYSPYFFIQMKEQIWGCLPKREREILMYSCVFPFVTGDFYRKVLNLPIEEETLYRLEITGLLRKEAKKGYVPVPFLKTFLQREDMLPEEKSLILFQRKAADWYEKHLFLQEMFLSVEQIGKRELAAAMAQYAKKMVRNIPLASIRRYLELIAEYPDGKSADWGNVDEKNLDGQNIDLWFLKGYVAVRDQDWAVVEQAEQILLHSYENAENEARKREIVTYYRNLTFLDSRIEITKWLEETATQWEGGELSLFTFSYGSPALNCGIRDFAPLFSGKIKEERMYEKYWNEIMDEPGRIALEMIKSFYYIQTERGSQVIENLSALAARVQTVQSGELLIGMYALMSYFQRMGTQYQFEAELEEIRSQIDKMHDPGIHRICEVLELYTRKSRGIEDDLGRWILYEAPEEREEELAENHYLYYLKARGYFILKQYKRADNLFKKLADYYEKMNLTQFAADCLFGQAASLYETGDKNQALILATKGLTLGMKYRYIEIYCHYGTAGLELIENYQKMMGIELGTKKQYYYGNVLRANYEGYQSILLRCAKREQRKILRSEKEEKQHSQLTITELTVLQYINGGASNEEISEKMNIKLPTVKTHVYNIFRKLGTNSRVQAVNEAKEKGLL